ncbi:MAG: ribonuclease P protein component [Candidatus Lindowbacteria bacterium]|nr:ribonuclease P protein component [Candidatus Lindowbacteria bacterium]
MSVKGLKGRDRVRKAIKLFRKGRLDELSCETDHIEVLIRCRGLGSAVARNKLKRRIRASLRSLALTHNLGGRVLLIEAGMAMSEMNHNQLGELLERLVLRQ